MRPGDMRQISFRMPLELAEALQRKAVQNDRTVSAEVRRAIRLHVREQLEQAVRRGRG